MVVAVLFADEARGPGRTFQVRTEFGAGARPDYSHGAIIIMIDTPRSRQQYLKLLLL